MPPARAAAPQAPLAHRDSSSSHVPLLTSCAAVHNYVLAVRQESTGERTRVRAEGAEPFICPEEGFVAHPSVGFRLRIRFPHAGMVTPMTGALL